MSKRKSDQYLEVDDEELDMELENVPMKESCDVVRRKIRTFLDSGEMKVGEFQKAINVTSKSYSTFMTQNGPYKGSGSSVYYSAWAFFQKREMRGLKMPKKKAKTDAAGNDQGVDIAGVVLPGEDDDSVEIYDTCDEIRRKISAHLQKPGVTQAQFLRDVAAQYRTTEKRLQSKQLNDFRSKKGPYAGNTSAIFYGAYVLFEKLRLQEGKPKSKKRQEMEQVWSREGGMDTERKRDRVWAHVSDHVSQDKYGRLNVVPGPTNPMRSRLM
ncbi:hypothetical protein K491DRAFT_692261 [Lophiostoma macrostomum CBS 122681]|uniref:DUF7726 domain-containing protein n=1 Tax=Lophiostoma macrostomum CBS 122681 TaxID=1314788 RepID=A0A6A6T9B4_9PLEO|nr:hypothetical protein K491DRAFT_692261 [Lophiostoma macrostomum CBS 122681]